MTLPLLESMGESGGSSANRYIGSLISLTSKSDIRYEGILYSVDTDNSNIALQNVRSFGTEGRKKDGPEIPARDKVYEYIVFRGTDIKDLQVKSSPSAQPDNDPAIISSQYSQPAAVGPVFKTPITDPAVGARPPPYVGLQPSSFQGNAFSKFPLDAAGSGSWGPPPPALGAHGTGLPLYWQDFYRSPSSHSNLQPQLFMPQPSHPLPPFPPLRFEPGHQQITTPQSLSEMLSLPMPAYAPQQVASSLSSAATLVASSAVSMSTSGPGITSVQISGKPLFVPDSSLAVSSVPKNTNVDPSSSIESLSAASTPAAKVSRKLSARMESQTQVPSPVLGSIQMSSDVALSLQAATITTSDSGVQQVQSGAEQVSKIVSVSGKNIVMPMQRSRQARKVTESPKAASESTRLTAQQSQQRLPSTQPLLPLPLSTAQYRPLIQGNGALRNVNQTRRGRGRGTGRATAARAIRPLQHFLEDFDFTAMNQLFNKDEVWGELGKGEAQEKNDAENESRGDGDVESHMSDKISIKSPVYVKDEFFDTLSCDALDRGEGRADRPKFSERKKIDTETFGSQSLRSHTGRGRGRGRLYRGGSYLGRERGRGRGNGYEGQGRGFKRLVPREMQVLSNLES